MEHEFSFVPEASLPRYDYQCKQCGNKFELKQSFDAESVAACTECGGTSNRVIYSVPVVFKGSGFYVNDYGKGNGANSSSNTREEKTEKKESSSEDKSESSKSEKKTDDNTKTTKDPAGKKE